ncbi:hypothetical protein ACQCT6_19945 [Cytobacillus gottheilii]|uniref:Uncharacterized protein n=1 Tax=Cytobacillus gottheilii TaxID=859144 RepID=A0ABX8F7Z0_9BACI|nr:hypothetical protein [Cytobacillus gottheilii]QVY59858.1 hypothetical protein J1899_12410 [Cytobacillus gottheilii]
MTDFILEISNNYAHYTLYASLFIVFTAKFAWVWNTESIHLKPNKYQKQFSLHIEDYILKISDSLNVNFELRFLFVCIRRKEAPNDDTASHLPICFNH